MRTQFGSPFGQTSPFGAVFSIVILSLPIQGFAGVAPTADSPSNDFNFRSQYSSEVRQGPDNQTAKTDDAFLSLPAPEDNRIASLNANTQSDVIFTMPQIPADLAPAADTSNNSASAIPLPPAIQSGLTGLVALGLGAGVRRLRRSFR